MKTLNEFVRGVCANLRKEDFNFYIQLGEKTWDVYSFQSEGLEGQVAFRRKKDGRYSIDYFRAGQKSKEEIQTALEKQEN